MSASKRNKKKIRRKRRNKKNKEILKKIDNKLTVQDNGRKRIKGQLFGFSYMINTLALIEKTDDRDYIFIRYNIVNARKNKRGKYVHTKLNNYTYGEIYINNFHIKVNEHNGLYNIIWFEFDEDLTFINRFKSQYLSLAQLMSIGLVEFIDFDNFIEKTRKYKNKLKKVYHLNHRKIYLVESTTRPILYAFRNV